jgi:hypothetical protein
MSIKSFFVGKSDKTQPIERFNPQQKGFQGQALNRAQSLLPGLANPIDTSSIADRYREYLTNKVIPQQAEQYGLRYGTTPENSGGFQNFLGSAFGELEGNLADMDLRAQQQEQMRQMQLFNLLSGVGMEPQQQHQFIPGRPGLLQNLTSGLGSYLGSGAGPIAFAINSLLGGGNPYGGRQESNIDKINTVRMGPINVRKLEERRRAAQAQQSPNQNQQLAAILQLLQQQQQSQQPQQPLQL